MSRPIAPKKTLKVTGDTIVDVFIKWLIFNPWTATTILAFLFITLPAIYAGINFKIDCGCEDGSSNGLPIFVGMLSGAAMFLIIRYGFMGSVFKNYLWDSRYCYSEAHTDYTKKYNHELSAQLNEEELKEND